ncbi:MAG: hypothetical protein M4579_000842 [Chaenotheca gracillima]|nr:MAG: hypothetical protein M4579_000842 [Chaenotheca gracillima]
MTSVLGVTSPRKYRSDLSGLGIQGDFEMSQVRNTGISDEQRDSFEGTQARTSTATNPQLSTLLQAVTSARERETPSLNETPSIDASTRSLRGLRRSQSLQAPHFPSQPGSPERGGRSRRFDDHYGLESALAPIQEVSQLRPPSSSRKRKRGSDAAKDSTRAPNGRRASTLEFRELPPQPAVLDAKAAGVHSAAALFRQPSALSQKYTRPPMSKLFSSLELSPENFLHLQAAAKSYMLNDAYPERRACVGHRGTGDTDMVRLRLFNCVKDFLEIGQYGQRFFGDNVSHEGTPGQRKLVWPAQKQEIIAAVTPLLRRMVTNERQRQYALETRKGGALNGKKRKADQMEDSPTIDPGLELMSQPQDRTEPRQYFEVVRDLVPSDESHEGDRPSAYPEPPGQVLDDPSRTDWDQHLSKRKKLPSAQSQDLGNSHGPSASTPTVTNLDRAQILTPPETTIADLAQARASDAAVLLHLNLIKDGARLCPRLDILSTSCDSLDELLRHVRSHLNASAENPPQTPEFSFKGLTEHGLVSIDDDLSLAGALQAVRNSVWMDNELKVVASIK